MHSKIRTMIGTGALVLAVGALGLPAAHAAYPDRATRIVVPTTPGGSSDIAARILAKLLQDDHGQPVYVENKPGANLSLGTADVARAAPDGYSLLFSFNTLWPNTILYKSTPYKAEQLTPVALLLKVPYVFDLSKTLPVSTLQDFVKHAKANPGKVNYATYGPGSSAHIVSEAFAQLAGIKMVAIPYKGAAGALTGLIGGEVHFYLENPPSSIAQMKAGKINIVAVTDDKRLESLPNVPTLTELGYPLVMGSWYGIHVPTGTPAAITTRLNTAFRQAVAKPEYKEYVKTSGGTVDDLSIEQFDKYIKEQFDTWKNVVLPLKLQLD